MATRPKLYYDGLASKPVPALMRCEKLISAAPQTKTAAPPSLLCKGFQSGWGPPVRLCQLRNRDTLMRVLDPWGGALVRLPRGHWRSGRGAAFRLPHRDSSRCPALVITG